MVNLYTLLNFSLILYIITVVDFLGVFVLYHGFTLFKLMKSLAGVGPPLKKADSSVMLGLVSAVEAMCDVTDYQRKQIAEGQPVSNCGRIICITQLKKYYFIQLLFILRNINTFIAVWLICVMPAL